jgi:magnesium-transporting ATPase (P-type)
MGLNVWMITGDKAETAIAISQQCDLLSEDHYMERLVGLNGEPLRQRIFDLQGYFDLGSSRNLNLSVSDECFSLSISAYEESMCSRSSHRDQSSITGSVFSSGGTLKPSDATLQRHLAPVPPMHTAKPSTGTHQQVVSHAHSHATPSRVKSAALSFVQPLLGGLGSGQPGNINGSSGSGGNIKINGPSKKLALIVDGASLEAIWSIEDIRQRFTSIVCNIPTVIACRVSPKQKAALVHMIKSGQGNPITLAIGDGANDVGMIHEARVGVGIAGKEGRHAANSSDFAIGQFRFLVTLMLEHGRYNYIRCCKLVLYSFFKNLLLVSVLFYFCIYSGFSGTVPLDSIIFSGYNFYLGLPIIALGALDMDVPRESLSKHPYLAYNTGRCAELLNLRNMTIWCVTAFLDGFLLFAVGLRMVSGPDAYVTNGFEIRVDGPGLNNADGQGMGLFEVGYLLYSCIFLSMQNKVMLMTTTRTYINWTLWILSTIGFFGFTWVYGVSPTIDWYNVVPLAFSCGDYWMAIIVVPVMLMMADNCTDGFFGYLWPSSSDKLLWLLKHSDLPSQITASKSTVQSVRLNDKFVQESLQQQEIGDPNRKVGFREGSVTAETMNPVPQRASDASTSSEVSVRSYRAGGNNSQRPIAPAVTAPKEEDESRASFGMTAGSFDGNEYLE